MPTFATNLYVEGQAIGAMWQFMGRVLVNTPAGSNNWQLAAAGEATVELWEVKTMWFDELLDTKQTNNIGETYFNTVGYESKEYKLLAEHNVSHSKTGVRFEVRNDGTWEILEVLTP